MFRYSRIIQMVYCLLYFHLCFFCPFQCLNTHTHTDKITHTHTDIKKTDYVGWGSKNHKIPQLRHTHTHTYIHILEHVHCTCSFQVLIYFLKSGNHVLKQSLSHCKFLFSWRNTHSVLELTCYKEPKTRLVVILSAALWVFRLTGIYHNR